jgi:hypothetical protein
MVNGMIIKVDFKQYFKDYSWFGFYISLDTHWATDEDGVHSEWEVYRWKWSRPVMWEPWHGCHKIDADPAYDYENDCYYVKD